MSMYVCKKSHAFCYISICMVLLAYADVFGDDLHYCFIIHFMSVFLPLKCFTLFFSMELLTGYLKAVLLEIEGISDG